MTLFFKTVLSAAMVLALTGSSPGQQKKAGSVAQSIPEAEKTLQSAGELMQSGKFQEAEPLLKQAAKLAPSSPVPHNLLGFVYEQLKQSLPENGTGERTAVGERSSRSTDSQHSRLSPAGSSTHIKDILGGITSYVLRSRPSGTLARLSTYFLQTIA